MGPQELESSERYPGTLASLLKYMVLVFWKNYFGVLGIYEAKVEKGVKTDLGLGSQRVNRDDLLEVIITDYFDFVVEVLKFGSRETS